LQHDVADADLAAGPVVLDELVAVGVDQEVGAESPRVQRLSGCRRSAARKAAVVRTVIGARSWNVPGAIMPMDKVLMGRPSSLVEVWVDAMKSWAPYPRRRPLVLVPRIIGRRRQHAHRPAGRGREPTIEVGFIAAGDGAIGEAHRDRRAGIGFVDVRGRHTEQPRQSLGRLALAILPVS